MGYYTTVFWGVKIPESEVKRFEAEVQKLRKKCIESDEGECKWFGYYYDISANEDGWIDFDQSTRKWYEEESFYDWLVQFKPEGSFILIGESMDGAVVMFKNGQWKLYDIWDAVKCLEEKQ